MGRKRGAAVVELSSSGGDSDDEDYQDVQCAQRPFMGDDSDDSPSDTLVISEGDTSSDSSALNQELYDKYLKHLHKMKKMKKSLRRALSHKSQKHKRVKKSTDGFTRFSASSFMNVICSLSDDQKAVIHSYGFGSLLMFDKCVVPNSFARWIAHLVDSKSGDIVHDGKVISLTEESVNQVLDLPIGTRSFPSDPSIGKDLVLQKFGKDRMPPISFFADKLVKRESLSDDDMMMCFMIVALASFLCPNSNNVPSPKYLGIFEDMHNMREFRWCEFVLHWLLDHVKAFNRCKDSKVKRSSSLGGCLYYLAVVYLDHIDFGQRLVDPSIPRILVWKGDLIQTYSKLDLKSPGVYGFRPMLNFNDTCYFKFGRLKSVSCVDDLDLVFCAKLDSACGCKLPSTLKLKISQLIDQYAFNDSSFNVDVGSLGNVSKEFQKMFGKLLNHVCRVDVRSKELIVDVMQAISEAVPEFDDVETVGNNGSRINIDDTAPVGDETENTCGRSNVGIHIDLSNEVKRGNSIRSINQVRDKSSVGIASGSNPGSSAFSFRNSLPMNHVVDKLSCGIASGSKVASGSKGASGSKDATGSKGASGSKDATGSFSLRNPLCDRTNVDIASGSHQKSSSHPDFILIDDDTVVPDSVPSCVYRSKSKSVLQKILRGAENVNPSCVEQHVVSTPLPLNNDGHDEMTPKVCKNSSKFAVVQRSALKSSGSKSQEKDTSPVVCTGSRSLFQRVRFDMKRADDIYNSKLDLSGLNPGSSDFCLDKTRGCPSQSSVHPEGVFKSMDSSSGGKVPHYGPRRLVRPSRFFGPEYERINSKFIPSKSEIQNYNAICGLANSASSSANALYFGGKMGGVRCTFWSLGESMKFGGTVNNFVMAAFCYHLYCRSNVELSSPKCHYFFPNISANLLKNHGEVDASIMSKAFTRSPKSRPLHRIDLLYFPVFYEDHWFVFIVDMNDQKYVFLDSLYAEEDDYQDYAREQMIPEFEFWWNKFVKVEKKFEDFEYMYPDVPKHSATDECDSGVFAMMFLEHWTSPRSSLCSLFSRSDIVNIRTKLCNDMLFNPRNSGDKNLVIAYLEDEVEVHE